MSRILEAIILIHQVSIRHKFAVKVGKTGDKFSMMFPGFESAMTKNAWFPLKISSIERIFIMPTWIKAAGIVGSITVLLASVSYITVADKWSIHRVFDDRH